MNTNINYWTNIYPQMIIRGFDIDNLILDKLVKKDFEYIFDKMKKISIIKFDENKIDFTIEKNGNTLYYFKIISNIGGGSYNTVYHIINKVSDKNYALRIPIYKLKTENSIIDNFTETFIHTFLTIYQKKYLIKDTETKYIDILKLKLFFFNPKNRYIGTIIELKHGMLYDLLKINIIDQSNKVLLLIKCLLLTINLLINLQSNFKFVHNDLKANNIFYSLNDDYNYNYDNVNFYIGDFDGVRMEIDNKIITGNNCYSESSDFNPRKDLFLLIHSIYYKFYDSVWMETFFNKFILIPSIIRNNKKFIDLYYYSFDEIDKLYEPINLKEHIKNNFPDEYDKIMNDIKSDEKIIIKYNN